MAAAETSSKKRSFKLIDSFGGLVRAGTEAAAEIGVGTVRVVAGTFTGVAQSVADNVNSTVVDAIDVAQRGADRFLSVLDETRKAGDEPKDEPIAATPAKKPA